ncbi:MAG TPA: phosphoribosylformylglycinamidine cyclo-ligase [Candidatus Dormibacteraeota bacterium]|jgi:phosphoribosylformylglycinamidine cyclo-ligase|nr:phosphoribosylformylglycinamidine cyclo-ligase [Candidatus Dormibacteraeota bacterium]
MGDLRYIDAGVDIDAGNRAVSLIKEAVRSTHTPGVLGGIGQFAGSFALPGGYREPVLVSSTDSVGTKVKVAIACNRHRGIGVDLVNHCVNDIATSGAEPLFFLDYFATGKLQPELLAEIVEGAAGACRAAGCALVGGETAEMPGVYALGDYDIAGFIVGIVERDRQIGALPARAGDVLVGLPSSGLHTNGFSLVRYLFQAERMQDPYPELRPYGAGSPPRGPGAGTPEADGAGPAPSLADVLLVPHRSYLAELRLARDAVQLAGAAHVTGGGLKENVPRALPEGLGAELETSAWTVPPVFRLIESRGVLPEEMWRTFNMGIGMVLVVRPADLSELLRALDGSGAVPIGHVVPQDGPERTRLT